jgi:uncharacterized protein (TIGR02145 family)
LVNTKGIFMVPIKTLLTGLLGVSLCMADISGIVTDTGATPIAGAIVKLENAGWTATTGADGSFTLSASTGILPGHGKLLPNGLSAGITGKMLKVTIAGQSVVEVTTFDLCGKSLSTVRKTLCAGSHSIALPHNGAGIFLYKVRAGNSEIVLEGNTDNGVSSGSAVSSQSPASNRLAKQALSTAAINDIITVTKTGYLNYRCVQYTSDTTGIQIKVIASAGTVTDTDGNVYQTVQIGTQVWTVENLMVTKYNDGSSITLDTSSATWAANMAGKYCFYKNTTNADSIKKYGALYNWYAVNTGKLAPASWHVPTDAEWDTLQNYLIAKGYNWDVTTTGNKTAKSLAAKTDWPSISTAGTIGCDLTMNNSSGFSALPGGYRSGSGFSIIFSNQSNSDNWWSVTESDASNAYNRYLSNNRSDLTRSNNGKGYGFAVRLVRNN